MITKHIYCKIWPYLVNLSEQIIHNHHDAEDIVQNVFIEEWQSKKKNTFSWIRNKVVWRTYDAIKYKSRQKRNREMLTDNLDDYISHQPIRIDWESLPDRLYNIIDLKYQEYTNNEIAAILNINEKTVRRKLRQIDYIPFISLN